MKKTIILVFVMLTSANLFAADTLRVNNNPGVQADYATLNDAVVAAGDGDVIYLENSPDTYGSCQITKKLHIIGIGYFLEELEDGPVQLAGSICNNIYFEPGSEGSVLEGVTIYGMPGDYKAIYINTSNIKIIRNAVRTIWLTENDAHISDVVISQNYFLSGGISERAAGSCHDLLISNNILYGSIMIDEDSRGVITNNVLGISSTSTTRRFELENLTFQNNICHYFVPTYTNCVVNNNLYLGITGENENGNIYGYSPEDIFTVDGTEDGKWQLKENAPAIGAGLDGVDMGAFDGPFPYRLSGLPATPYIYDADIPASGTAEAGLPVSVKIKSNN